MFEHLDQLPNDPILGLMTAFKNDENSDKVDLGVGVYKTETGETPIFKAVKQAETQLLGRQDTKSYVQPQGDPLFIDHVPNFLLNTAALERRAIIQTPGGCGALRLAAELVKTAKPEARLWLSDPSWGNHYPLLAGAGLKVSTYPYYDIKDATLRFNAMYDALSVIPAGDLVLLHGCCHNPSGADLTDVQWEALTALFAERGIIPLIDVAYQGFSRDLSDDMYGVRYMVDRLPETLLATSFSKNFGLYRERIGALICAASTQSKAQIQLSHLLSIARGLYSMPPNHGASIVATILGNETLKISWQEELSSMRHRINDLRYRFSHTMAECLGDERFSFMTNQRGMFSLLGLKREEVDFLKGKNHIYLLDSSRVNIAGLNNENLDRTCQAIKQAISTSTNHY